jgi:hypothetical protein
MKNLLGSIAIHAVLAGVGACFFLELKPTPSKETRTMLVETFREASPVKGTGSGRGQHARGRAVPGHLNLVPLFARNGFSLSTKIPGESELPNEVGRDLLLTEPKIVQVFDLLANRVNGHLDYPLMLAENGVYGLASLDLYFDHDGNVDEYRSKCGGANRVVRGLLVEATRSGLLEWFANEAKRIRRDQFRDQHFRADFMVSAVENSENSLSKAGPEYHFVRRIHYNPTCLEPGTVDLACAGMRIIGLIKGKDDKYLMKFEALKESTERFDDLGLSGINELLRQATGA